MHKIFFSLLFICILFSCGTDRTDLLIGQWSAVSVTQDNTPLDIDMSLVGFQFNKHGDYNFTSTLDYTEAGYYRIEDDKLFTTDTLRTETEKAVLIEKLESDSLKLRMKNKDGWMNLILAKK